jgi:putative ABC transport system permease protein
MKTLVLIWKLFRRTAQIQKKRMAMTVAAIAWGTLSIVLLLSFGEGMQRGFRKNQKGLGDGIVIVWAGSTSKAHGGFSPGRQLSFRTEDAWLLRDSIPEMGEIAPEMQRWGTQVQYGRGNLNKKAVGTVPAFAEMRSHYPEAGGRFINDSDETLKRRVVFLGNKVRDELFKGEDAVGKIVLLNQTPFTVIGVLAKKIQMGTYSGPDEDAVTMPLSTFRALYGRERLSDIVFRAKNPRDNELVKKRFYEVMGGKYRFDPEDKRALQMWDTLESAKVMTNISLGIKFFLGFIGTLTLIVGGVGVANIMYAVVKHRTKEIGVQMALGAKRSYVIGPLVLEALSLTAFGGVIGIGIGWSLVELLGFVQSKTSSEAVQFIGKPTFSLPIALAVVFILGTIGFLSGYFPSRRAAAVQPAVALRYE